MPFNVGMYTWVLQYSVKYPCPELLTYATVKLVVKTVALSNQAAKPPSNTAPGLLLGAPVCVQSNV